MNHSKSQRILKMSLSLQKSKKPSKRAKDLLNRSPRSTQNSKNSHKKSRKSNHHLINAVMERSHLVRSSHLNCISRSEISTLVFNLYEILHRINDYLFVHLKNAKNLCFDITFLISRKINENK